MEEYFSCISQKLCTSSTALSATLTWFSVSTEESLILGFPNDGLVELPGLASFRASCNASSFARTAMAIALTEK